MSILVARSQFNVCLVGAALACTTAVVACAAGSGPQVGDLSGAGSTSSTGGRPALEEGSGGTPTILVPGGGAGSEPDGACAVAILGEPGSNPASNFSAWIAARGPIVQRYSPGGELQALTASDLSGYEVALLDWLAPGTVIGITPQELESWVRGGGRLIALSGYGDYPEALEVQNQMLAPLDLGFVTTEIQWGPVTDFAAHPITEGLTSISFIGGREVTHAAGDEVVMTLHEPPKPVGVAAVRGSGKVFAFGDEWITYDSEWSSIPEIQQMWVNIFDWLGDCELVPIIS